MAVRHDKCRAPSLFPPTTCRTSRKRDCDVESTLYHDPVTAAGYGTGRGHTR
jgi:hypothetical protein